MLPGYVLGLGPRTGVGGLFGTGRNGIGGIILLTGIFLIGVGLVLLGRGVLFAFVGAEPSAGVSAALFCPMGEACGDDGAASGE